MREYPRLECSSAVNITGGNNPGVGPAVAEFGGLLHLFHRAGEGATIHYRTSADGCEWSDDRSLADRAGARTGDQPVVIGFGGRLYVLFRGESDGARLEVCSTDGLVWEKATRVGRGESVRMSTRPAAIVFRGRLRVFFRGASATSTLFTVSTANGLDWSAPVNLTEATRGARTAGAPFPVVFDDRLVVLMRDPVTGRIGVCRTGDGANWSAYSSLAGTESEEPPVAVVHGSRLVVFYQGHGGMVCSVACTPGGGWADHGVIPRSAQWPPVPLVLGERLTLLARDYLDPRTLGVVDTSTGADWTEQPTLLRNVAGAPAVAVRGHRAIVISPDGPRLAALDLLAPDAWGARVADVPAVAALLWADAANHARVARYRDHCLIPGRDRLDVLAGDGERVHSFPGTRGQLIGDYLALAAGDTIRCHDLRPLAAGRAPTPVATIDVDRALAVGITAISSGEDRRYVVAVHDGLAVTFLESTPAPLWAPECRFTPLFAVATGELDSITLLTDAAGEVHLLSFVPGGRVRHHRVDFSGEALYAAGEHPAERVRIPDQHRVDLLAARRE